MPNLLAMFSSGFWILLRAHQRGEVNGWDILKVVIETEEKSFECQKK